MACRCPSLQWVCYSHQCTIKNNMLNSASYIWLDRVLVDSIVWILEIGAPWHYAVAIQYMIYKNDPLINIAMQWVITMYYKMWCDHSASLDSLFYIWLDRIVDTIISILHDTKNLGFLTYCTRTLHIEHGITRHLLLQYLFYKNDPLLNVAMQQVITL